MKVWIFSIRFSVSVPKYDVIARYEAKWCMVDIIGRFRFGARSRLVSWSDLHCAEPPVLLGYSLHTVSPNVVKDQKKELLSKREASGVARWGGGRPRWHDIKIWNRNSTDLWWRPCFSFCLVSNLILTVNPLILRRRPFFWSSEKRYTPRYPAPGATIISNAAARGLWHGAILPNGKSGSVYSITDL